MSLALHRANTDKLPFFTRWLLQDGHVSNLKVRPLLAKTNGPVDACPAVNPASAVQVCLGQIRAAQVLGYQVCPNHVAPPNQRLARQHLNRLRVQVLWRRMRTPMLLLLSSMLAGQKSTINVMGVVPLVGDTSQLELKHQI
jgi:hypothetical protein